MNYSHDFYNVKLFVFSCRRSLLPHAEIICKLLVQTLKWTKVDDCEFGQRKPYR